MSDFTYFDVYTLIGAANGSKADIGGFRAIVEERLLQVSGAEELTADLRGRLDSELGWVERSGRVASWLALARLVEVAHERRVPLGAPIGCADGTLIGSVLCSLPYDVLRSVDEPDASPPPGVEVPGERREELLRAVVQGGSWTGWSPGEGGEVGQAALWLRPSSVLSTLDAALRVAVEHPSLGFAPESGNPSGWPTLSEGASALLKKADVAGIAYLSAAALKSWKGDASAESMGAIVARSLASSDRTKPPEGVAAWAEHTGDTGGALLYYDQFARIVESAVGISSGGAATLRLAMLNGQADVDGALRARFLVGCTSSGLDEAGAESLWDALAVGAWGLVSRQAAYAWARVALWLANVKAAHPAAFIAAVLDVYWDQGGRAAIRPLVDNARRLGIPILPPDIGQSQIGPALENTEKGWAIRWGLAFLPGWGRHVAGRFVEARARLGNCASLSDLARVAVEVELSLAQLEALVRAGGCDRFGGQEGVMAAMPGVLEWAQQSRFVQGQMLDAVPGVTGAGTGACPYDAVAPGPRLRFARRVWEEQNLGVGFTDAHEMDELRRAIGEGAELSGRLTSSAGIGLEQVGQGVCLVGLLHDVRLLALEERDKVSGGKGEDKPVDAQQMAVAWVEDLDGAIELVAFPPNYKRHQELWTENNMVIITARVCRHADGQGVYLLCEHLAAYHAETAEEELNIIVNPARRNPASTVALSTPDPLNTNGGSHKPNFAAQTHNSLAEIRNPQSAIRNPSEPPTYQLIITLPASEDDREDIDRMIVLDRLFKAHVGPDTVTLRIPYSPETGAVTSAQLARGVRYSLALEGKIRELLGPDALALIKLLG